MEIDTENLLEQAVKQGLVDSIRSRLQYRSVIDDIINQALRDNVRVREMFEEAILAVVNDAAFRVQLAADLRTSMANLIVNRFGAELQRQVNQLKSDPVTRTRIVTALEQIVKERLPS